MKKSKDVAKGKTDSMDQATKAELIRGEARGKCDERNLRARAEAVEKFEAGETARLFRDNADYITGLVVIRLKAIQEGETPTPIRPYESELLLKLLTAETESEYVAGDFDENMSDSETIAAWEKGRLIDGGYLVAVETPTTALQRKLRSAVCDYVRASASYAKHIKSSSLDTWAEMLELLELNSAYQRPDEVRSGIGRLMELWDYAAKRLRRDDVIYHLPPFKPVKAVRKGK